MNKILDYLNPIDHLGENHYSFIIPLLVNVLLCVLSEIFAYDITKNPMIIGVYIIELNIALIIYFAFREGLMGGYISAVISIAYYFYIVYSRHFVGGQMNSSLVTIFVLALIYFLLAGIIGWLKQKIDTLIERETEGKRRLETIIQQLPVGVLITDSQGRLIQSNKRIDKILGIKIPIGFKFGKETIENVVIGGKKLHAPFVKAIKFGKTYMNNEVTFNRQDGRNLSLTVSSTPILNQKKKLIATASIISDVTQEKELEQQKDDFLSMASHELKTPITSLKMFVELQARQLKEKNHIKAKYFNNRIYDQTNRLKELTNELLDVSRIQTGKLRYNIEEFDISQVVSDTVEGLRGTSKRHEIQLLCKAHQKVKGDRYRIYQVIVNLIANAIKYSPNGNKIVVQVKNVKGKVIVSIQDFGIGISQENKLKIFNRLYQVTDAEEKTYPGLGMGLYIAKEIITGHNGKIWVESTQGKGSTFFFSLP